jgi:hypothetical protein
VAIRHIGDGVTTNIWQDRWIPGAIGGRPICPKHGASAVHVSELLSVSWDEAALANNLLCMDT